MKEEQTTTGCRIYPFSDSPLGLGGYVEVFFDSEFLNPEDRQKIRINIYFPNGMIPTEKTRLLIDALERGINLIADNRSEKLKKELT